MSANSAEEGDGVTHEAWIIRSNHGEYYSPDQYGWTSSVFHAHVFREEAWAQDRAALCRTLGTECRVVKIIIQEVEE